MRRQGFMRREDLKSLSNPCYKAQGMMCARLLPWLFRQDRLCVRCTHRHQGIINKASIQNSKSQSCVNNGIHIDTNHNGDINNSNKNINNSVIGQKATKDGRRMRGGWEGGRRGRGRGRGIEKPILVIYSFQPIPGSEHTAKAPKRLVAATEYFTAKPKDPSQHISPYTDIHQ